MIRELLFFFTVAGTFLNTVSALKCSQCKNFVPGRVHPVVAGGCAEPDDYITVTCPPETKFCFNSSGSMYWNTTQTTPPEYDAFSGVFTSCGIKSAYDAFGANEWYHTGYNDTGILTTTCRYTNEASTGWLPGQPDKYNYTTYRGTQCMCDTDNCNEYIPRPLNCTQCKNFNPSIIHPIGKCSEPEDYITVTCPLGTQYCINMTGSLYWSNTFVNPPQSDHFSGVFAACGTHAAADALQISNLDDFIDASLDRTCKINYSSQHTVNGKPGSNYTQINGTICICETHNCNSGASKSLAGVHVLVVLGMFLGLSLLTN